MLTMEDYAKQPREQCMQHLTRTGDELAAAIKGQSDAVLSRRPDAKNWAAKEVICHLRDTEEVFGARLEQIVAMDVEPKLVATNPDRWAEERQYLANDAGGALAAFRQRRAETLETFGKLTPAQWEKGGIHPVLGRTTLNGFLSVMAWHDENHLDQLTRALQGRA
jgi:ribonucleotide monophosphatase NagD (HAD superfamily)